MNKYIGVAVLCLALITASCSSSKESGKENGKSKKDKKSIEEITESCRQYDGLFTMYRDTASGKLYLQIEPEQVSREFIHFSQVANGVLDAGYFKGAYRGARIFKVERFYDRVDFVLQNYTYHFDENNALSRSKKTNINYPVILSEKIKAENDTTGAMLIEADDLFMQETFLQIKPSYNSKYKGFKLGKLSKDKSKVTEVRNYPENTDVTASYVYEDNHPDKRGSSAVTDSRFVTVQLHHSLIAVPENDYQIRYDDPRAGYFMTKVNDMTSTDIINYRDRIHRWHLKKKDPDAELSEPEEPVVWWIENTTPEKYRNVIKDAVLRWNAAFERIGFKDAVRVYVQPDDADWDAGDIRYNVIRWTSSPRPPFGGYGPSFVNPRTGQILGADVMIEFASISRRLQRQDVFEKAGLFFDDFLDESGEYDDHRYCSMGSLMNHATQMGHVMHSTRASGEKEKEEFVNQILYRLMLHEVGHTLGLNHNFKASLLNSPENIHDLENQRENGLASSVMEYPAINFAPEGKEQGLYFDTKPGPYDMWVIEFGYSPALDDEEAERERLEKILSRSSEPQLAFANDADDMRSAGKGIDPFAMIYDLTDDPVTYAEQRLELVNATYPKLEEKYLTAGETYHELRNAFLILNTEYAISLRVISRHVAGVRVDRSLIGQDKSTLPFTPMTKAEQQRAVKILEKYAFSPEAFSRPDELYNKLQMQRRGFDHFSRPEDPKIHARILNIQKDLLDHLLHHNTLNRFVDTELYGNEYGLGAYMNDLAEAVFKADLKTRVTPVRQNLQVEFVNRLIAVIDNGSSEKNLHTVRAAAHRQLEKIKAQTVRGSTPDESSRAHRNYIVYMIDKALEI